MEPTDQSQAATALTKTALTLVEGAAVLASGKDRERLEFVRHCLEGHLDAVAVGA